MPNNPLAQISGFLPPQYSPVEPVLNRVPGPLAIATPESPTPPGFRRVLARRVEEASDDIMALVRSALEGCAQEAAGGASFAAIEAAVGRRIVEIGQHLLTFAFASACRSAMARDIRERGLAHEDVRLRTDEDGYCTTHTTFGPIAFPTFAYRDLSSPLGAVTRNPARVLFPHHRSCHSSPLCLEWEMRLGLQHPFRRAEELLHFFTRGASTIEDTTIARHMLALSRMIDPEWLYLTPDKLRQTLKERATRDKITQRPLLYVSSDAHALRRYVGDTWALQWKMVNGVRVWCEDAVTGAIIHLGGEFTWGDCHEVGDRIRALLKAGILPNGDAAWAEINAQIVFPSDGAAWLLEHIVPLLVDAIVILDPYHLIDWFTQFATVALGVGSARSLALHAELRRILFNKRPQSSARAPTTRRGHKKKRRRRNTHAYDRQWDRRGRPRTVSSDATARALLDLLATVVVKAEHEAALEALVERVANNTLRIDYATHLAHGLEVGSGAMESLHRTGSQLRLKLPGARWLEDTSHAVLKFRMLELSGRSREFWDRADLVSRIAESFARQAA